MEGSRTVVMGLYPRAGKVHSARGIRIGRRTIGVECQLAWSKRLRYTPAQNSYIITAVSTWVPPVDPVYALSVYVPWVYRKLVSDEGFQ